MPTKQIKKFYVLLPTALIARIKSQAALEQKTISQFMQDILDENVDKE